VDDNSAYDTLVEEGQDAEDRYFDGDGPDAQEMTSQLGPDDYDYWFRYVTTCVNSTALSDWLLIVLWLALGYSVL